jgi:putative aldouronate transport system substrate-binding protein
MWKNWFIKVFGVIIVLAFVLVFAFRASTKEEAAGETITIGITANQYIQDFDSNYYKLWLEEQTGLKLAFCVFPEEYTAEYLGRMFESGSIAVDALFSFSGTENSDSSNSILQEYGQLGYIIPLNSYIENSAFMQELFADFAAYDLKNILTSPDGNIYYMPGLDTSYKAEYPQVMWINNEWLSALKLEIPQTTEDLKAVLYAFKNGDPNGNGLHDETALAGSRDKYSEQSYNYLMNAFVYNDPNNSRMLVEDGAVHFAPLTQKWREGVQYIHDLYSDGLLDEFQFTLDHGQLIQLANDPRDLLGAFTSASICDVLLQSSPELLSNFIRVAPLAGSDGTQFATINTPLPRPNGIITSACKDPETVFRLFEIMLSPEAFLVGRFGEEGVDWKYAQPGEIDVFGNQATISRITQLWNKIQNKHLLETGPFITYAEYANGVKWNGIESESDSTDARAYHLYSQYRPDEYLRTILFEGKEAESLMNIKSNVDRYTDEMLAKFITGNLDPYDDSHWDDYIKHYRTLGIDTLIDAAQDSYYTLQQE